MGGNSGTADRYSEDQTSTVRDDDDRVAGKCQRATRTL
jgi:hypothetical protein